MGPILLLIFTTLGAAAVSERQAYSQRLQRQIRKRFQAGFTDAAIAYDLDLDQATVSRIRLAEVKYFAERGFPPRWISREFGGRMSPEMIERMLPILEKKKYEDFGRLRRRAA